MRRAVTCRLAFDILGLNGEFDLIQTGLHIGQLRLCVKLLGPQTLRALFSPRKSLHIQHGAIVFLHLAQFIIELINLI